MQITETNKGQFILILSYKFNDKKLFIKACDWVHTNIMRLCVFIQTHTHTNTSNAHIIHTMFECDGNLILPIFH